jgi:CTP synthase (UTP-ammonia lyase)
LKFHSIFLLDGSFNLQKTKPTQHSVRQLRGLGLIPNLLACRSSKVCLFLFAFSFHPQWFSANNDWMFLCCPYQELDENVKAKLSQFCHVPVTDTKELSNTFSLHLSLKSYIYIISKQTCESAAVIKHTHTLWCSKYLAHSFAVTSK